MSQVKNSIDVAVRRSWNALPKGVQSNIRPLLRKQDKSGWRRYTGSVKEPLLSVIIPVHNVSAYLKACLESVLSQDYSRLEVIVVDDGSTDGSDDIVRQYGERDERIKFVQIPHSGNGIARNRGVAIARGEYLTFVDSDDVVMQGSYSHMVGRLVESGSDFAVGAFRRRKGGREWLPEMMAELHGTDRIGIRVEEFPDILRDVFLWNKVFRKDFWDASVGAIPEGVLYEDQEPIVRAFLRSRSFDVLSRPVYVWRIREDNSSITQQKGSLTDLIDRMKAARIVTDFVLAEASEGVRNAWFTKSLGEDLRLYINKVPNSGDEYWSVLQRSVSTLYGLSGPDVLCSLPLQDRVLAFLIAEDRRSDVEAVLVGMRDHGRTFPVAPTRVGLVGLPIFSQGLSVPLPTTVLRVEEADIAIRTRLLDFKWLTPDTVQIRGAAYLTGIDSSKFTYTTSLSLINTATGESKTLDAVVEPDARIDQVSEDRWNTYAETGFTALIPTANLLGAGAASTTNGQEWVLRVIVSAGGFTKSDVIRHRDGELLPFQLPKGPALGRRRVVAQMDRAKGFRLRTVGYELMAHSVSSRGRFVEFTFDGQASPLPLLLVLKNEHEHLISTATDTVFGRCFRVEVPETPASNREVSWDVVAQYEDNKSHYVGWPGSSDDLDSLPSPDRAVRIGTTGYGYLRVSARAWRVTVSDCRIDNEGKFLTLSGRSAHMKSRGERVLDLILATNRNVIAPLSVDLVPGTENFTAVFPLTSDKWGYGDAYPDAGHYRLLLRTIASTGQVSRQRVQASGGMLSRLPEEHMGDKARIALTAEDRDRNFVVKILAPFKQNERGPRAQQLLREEYLTGKGEIDKDAILFESFAGKSVTDSVKAISDELARRSDARRRYWSIADYSVPVPDGCTGVLMYSAEWYRLLNSAGTLINNNNFPHYFRKRDGQSYIQTWHGTPLKKIGNHTPLVNLTSSYRQLMTREAAAWDALLVQNQFAESVLPEAFGYSGRVICGGYPRNDILHGVASPKRRVDVRRTLGLAEGTTAILYTPTWRDNVRTDQNKFAAVNYLEFEKVIEASGNDCVVLFRGHHNIAGQRNTAGGSTFIDVTAYPEIADLYLAADMMITDYSSSMFDFCGTGKPLLFLAPDIDEYRTVTRGFYFDFESEAPGPILSSTEEVIDAVTRMESIREEYREAYKNFAYKYAPLDDGHAAHRIVDILFT
ncbi:MULTISPECIES: CDP-glycerol glycerophosphotransferase family protein [unclassified Arthrobacter]|uniref:bifunctional glycosyltransferase/CDP-glycerol:glycerophosphate glycerophosphotransferase n=1 Tax=unclassified Arthrobacter TaxID=235627 RepID=UPI001E463632|nr:MULTISPECIES: CDP-glycerol glycerophosphotransferase family protein [unclassified Arthrobacter]MCC9145760.1 bifunctional glycosyltransferase family 2 protein/CDP-glycerol:glycerophosphate glycerophosphotransferase [Arthrobacter sp. zg-Y919]MDK1276989.1 CDP-glycerol glycerophosphotransferase family protein [Arthrobacter sp. zg.Y919]WIB04083.1 CDP-glycerol glycerophosphotransferase family protein [Arthrobacter sp. zg-Y919]